MFSRVEYVSYQWLHIRNLHKYLGRQDWDSLCFFWMSYSCGSRCITELPWTCAQSDNMHCKATWLAELKHLVFLFLYSVATWNISKVLRLMFCLCWNCYEWLLQFEPSTINIYINLKSFGRQQPCLKCNFSLEENQFSEIIGMIETESVQMVHTSTFHSNNAAGLGHCN